MSDIKVPHYGYMTGHAIGLIMRDLVNRAIRVIRLERTTFTSKVKAGYDGVMDDLVTSADPAAQAIYIKSLRECFPTFGIVAEEDDLSIPCTHEHEIWFTVDPLDGTKAFGRRQSHGVGTMISLVSKGVIIASYIGDVNTQEIYGYRPGSNKVHRLQSDATSYRLEIDANRLLADQHIQCGSEEYELPEAYRCLLNHKTRLFKGYKNISGSIGTRMASLWKGEVGAILLHSRFNTPWDWCPILGISQKLGFLFLTWNGESESFEVMSQSPVKEVVETEAPMLVIHESRLEEFKAHHG